MHSKETQKEMKKAEPNTEMLSTLLKVYLSPRDPFVELIKYWRSHVATLSFSFVCLQVTREYRNGVRAELENGGERMAFKLLDTWPSLSKEKHFMDELAFVAFNGTKSATDMLQEATSTLRIMKSLVPKFELEVICQNPNAFIAEVYDAWSSH